MVTGDIGVGKTTVCRALLRRLPERFATALVVNTLLTEKELLRTVLEDFGVTVPGGTRKDLLDALNRFLRFHLLAEAEIGRRPVLIIDEAQNLAPLLLEQVRLLSNLETEKRKLLQIVLFGQKELQEKLRLPQLRQFDQRITVRATILPLDLRETSRYIQHRMSVAGASGSAFLSPAAERLIHRLVARGSPADQPAVRPRPAGGVRAQRRRVEREDVVRAADSLFGGSKGAGWAAWPWRWFRLGRGGAA